MWLGPAPWAAYHPLRCHFSFRWFMDYGGGSLADNGVHMFGVVSWAMGADRSGPVSVEARGREEPGNLFDSPVEMHVRYEFTDPPFVLTWDQPGAGQLNLDFAGSQATLSGFWDFAVTAGRADLSATRTDEIQLDRSDNHAGNWLECIRTRRRPIMDVEIGHRITCWSHLGNIAYRVGRKLDWDPVTECFPGDEEANRLLHAPYREPWHA
jgi:predicted dehydrogenase